MLEMNRVYLMDCMEGMAQIPDKYFELAIVDPPYGIGVSLVTGGKGHSFDNLILGKAREWDKAPPIAYFDHLFRVSRNQIIWGGNYFDLPPTRSPVCWDKVRPNQRNLSEWEMAWTSFEGRARLYRYCANGGFVAKEKRIHPTQKPTDLYKWLLSNYAKEGDKILDTHVGSGSSIIACIDMGFDYMGFEIDEDYYKAMQDRIYHFTRQTTLI
jgi:site-specific DNA-methyltransferase (adenine-specific)